MMHVSFLTVLLLILVGYLVYRMRHNRLEKLLNEFNGFPVYPCVGNLPQMWKFPFVSDSYDYLRSKLLDYSYKSPMKFWLFNRPYIAIFDAENIQTVSNKTLVKADEQEFLRPVYGNSLETINDLEMWKKRRHLLYPAISPKLMSRYLTVYNKFNRKLSQELNTLADTGQKINIWTYVHDMEYRRFFATFLGYDDEVEQEKIIDFTTYPDQMVKGLTYVVRRIMQPYLYSDNMNNLYNCLSGRNKLWQELRVPHAKLIEKHIVAKENTNTSVTESVLIDILLSIEASELYPEEEKIDEMMTFLIGATETTSSNVCFGLLMLAMHPDYQDQVYEELERVLGQCGSDKTIELEDLDQLVFLEQCIKETSRLFTVPNILRQSKEDLVLKDGRIIPGGVTCILCFGVMHRDARIYPNPEKFDPGRFTPEEIAKRHPCSFVPLSTGPRNCIAAKMASLSGKSQLATLIWRYKFTTDMKMSELRLTFDIKVRNIHGYPVYIQRRNKAD